MKNFLSSLALAAMITAMAGNAAATEGWYGRADAGYSVDGEIEVGAASADLDDDWMAGLGAGYGFANGWRLEGEAAYRSNEVGAADVDATSLMVNALYDFNRGGRFQPYLGVGAGGAQIDVPGDDDASWAWQGIAGIGLAINPRATLDLAYRYFSAQDAELLGADADYTHQAVTLGLRWQFAAPAAAPPPVAQTPTTPPPITTPTPPPCPASEFTVYFEWDRAELNQAALEVIDQAITRAQQCNIDSAVVVGHTDTSGSLGYNQGLSERRAAVVRDAMVARGMGASLITTDARGETDLARPTPDGVREPLNRRSAVTISFR